MLSFEDRIEISDLYARYAYAFDSNKPEEWAELFTPDGTFRFAGGGEIVGRLDLADFARTRNETAPNVTHHTSNVIAEQSEEGAEGKAYALAFRSDGEALRIVNIGSYADRLVKHEGRWRFASRCFTSCLAPALRDAFVTQNGTAADGTGGPQT